MSRPAPNFPLHDLTRSRDFPELELELVELDPETIINAMRVLLLSLQPFRDFAGPIAALSFIRSRELSTSIPGAKIGGDHEVGLAVDFKLLDMEPDVFFEGARTGTIPGATWDKLNLYSTSSTWHVAHRLLERGPPRGRIFIDWQRVG